MAAMRCTTFILLPQLMNDVNEKTTNGVYAVGKQSKPTEGCCKDCGFDCRLLIVRVTGTTFPADALVAERVWPPTAW